MSEQFDQYNDYIDEKIKIGELVFKHKEKKYFEEWMQIAYALDSLEEIAAGRSRIERDEEPDYAKDLEFKKQMTLIKKDRPVLFELPAATRRTLIWLANHDSRVSRWHSKLAAEKRSELTSPTVIRSRYQKDQASPV